jgi:hypothetical protein
LEETVQRFTRALVVILGLAITGSVVSLVSQKNATATNGAPVNITSPLPLPVTGNVSAAVTGTLGAQQSGNWNVGITGTPSIDVANTPTVNVNSLPPVSLASTTALSLHNLDDRGRNPYQAVVDMTGKCPGTTGPPEPECFFNFPRVPVGHRLVVQHVSGVIQITGLPPLISVGFVVPGLSPSSVSFLIPFVNLNGIVLSEFDQQVLVFYEQNLAPSVVVTPGSGTFVSPNNIQLIALTGYLVDCTVASCEPIVQ